MNPELHKPELAQRVQAQIQSDHVHDKDEPPATGAVVLAALQASHHRDIDLTPPRVRLTNARDVPF
jgi:hypothetical protein